MSSVVTEYDNDCHLLWQSFSDGVTDYVIGCVTVMHCVTDYVIACVTHRQSFSDGVTDYVIALSLTVSMSLTVSLTVVFV